MSTLFICNPHAVVFGTFTRAATLLSGPRTASRLIWDELFSNAEMPRIGGEIQLAVKQISAARRSGVGSENLRREFCKERAMTMPNERTKAVTDTRDFLKTIAGSESAVDFRLVRTLAIQLLRHFPDDMVLSLSASLLPGVWAQPKGGVSKTTDALGLERQ